jgi:hypothetical protein
MSGSNQITHLISSLDVGGAGRMLLELVSRIDRTADRGPRRSGDFAADLLGLLAE